MKLSFLPTPDVSVALNSLLDILERRSAKNGTRNTQHEPTQHRSIKVNIANLPLPTYFSQTDPIPRMIANEQFQSLENIDLIRLTWLPGETNHILQSISLPQTEHATRSAQHGTRNTQHESLYNLLQRIPISDHRNNLETLLLADKFRFPADDWRARALNHTLDKLRAGKSPSPFSLSASDFNSDLLAAFLALSTLQAETPYRVFSVRVFNDSKRFNVIKRPLVSLARLGTPEWKPLSAEEVLRELNLVANPTYLHLAGNWQFTTVDGEVLSLNGFAPSIGFPAAQIASIQTVSVHADSVLCIENLTSFHQQVDRDTRTTNGTRTAQHATICIHGNPSPSIRRLLRLIPDETKIYLWSDMDYGGFNILSQLRRTVNGRVQPHLMDIETLESNIPRARPLTVSDRVNLKRLLLRPELHDVRAVIEHLIERGLKLEQEGVEKK